jgi:hypothetical protein
MCRLALRSRDQTMRRLWPCSVVLGNVYVRKSGSVPRKNATGRSVDEKEQDSNVCLGRRPPSALNGDRERDTASASLRCSSSLSLALRHMLGPERPEGGPALCTRGSGKRFGIPKPRESGSVIGADRRSGPSCVLPQGVHSATRPIGEWGYNTPKYSPSYAGARAPRGGVTRQGVVLTDLQ